MRYFSQFNSEKCIVLHSSCVWKMTWYKYLFCPSPPCLFIRQGSGSSRKGGGSEKACLKVPFPPSPALRTLQWLCLRHWEMQFLTVSKLSFEGLGELHCGGAKSSGLLLYSTRERQASPLPQLLSISPTQIRSSMGRVFPCISDCNLSQKRTRM